MAAKEQEPKTKTSLQKLESFLKEHKEEHYNFEDEVPINKVSSGSLILDGYLGGGFGPGLHRFIGVNEGGKTSAALTVCMNYLETVPKSKGMVFPTEGRLSDEMKARYPMKFVYKPSDWKEGTVFVMETQVYEVVASCIRDFVLDFKADERYFFLVDSVDGLIPRADLTRDFDAAAKVAGGATIASHFMKRIAIPLAKFGHMSIFTSQVRSHIAISSYTASLEPTKQTNATGGNALMHYPNWILQFEPRYNDDMILPAPSKPMNVKTNPPLGHWAKVVVKKSPNEKSKLTISYPIKYGRTGGNSVWVEKEVADMLVSWDYVTKSGAWFKVSEELSDILAKQNLSIEKTFQGFDAYSTYFEKNKEVCDFLVGFLKENLV